MTNATPRVDQAVFRDDPIGIGDDSVAISNKMKDIAVHYLAPVSRLKTNLAIKFYDLKEKWEAETGHLSSVTEIAMNPAYQQIIGIGSKAIPYILSELKTTPGHWFWALKSITGEDPVLPEQRGRISQMTEAWLNWARQQGYPV